MIKFIFWTLPFGGLFAFFGNIDKINDSMQAIGTGQGTGCSTGCAGILGRILLTAAFWFGIYYLATVMGISQP